MVSTSKGFTTFWDTARSIFVRSAGTLNSVTKCGNDICATRSTLTPVNLATQSSRSSLEASLKYLVARSIAARRDSEYAPGKRSPDWLKFKCVNEQEFVIGGFTDPAGSRIGFGALLVGYYERGTLCYAGKVGTGFDTQTLLSLRRKLDARKIARPQFVDEVKENDVHWVKPELVAQIGFSEWTRDGKLRHPRFLGLRTDKPATQVVRERPQPA